MFSVKSGGSLGVASSGTRPDSSSAFFWASAAAWNRLRQADTSFDEMSIQPCSASAFFWAGLRVSAALPPAGSTRPRWPVARRRRRRGGRRLACPLACLAAAASSPTPAARDPSTTDRGTRPCSAGRERWACSLGRGGSRPCSPRSRRPHSLPRLLARRSNACATAWPRPRASSPVESWPPAAPVAAAFPTSGVRPTATPTSRGTPPTTTDRQPARPGRLRSCPACRRPD